jgi:hypothetical protein
MLALSLREKAFYMPFSLETFFPVTKTVLLEELEIKSVKKKHIEAIRLNVLKVATKLTSESFDGNRVRLFLDSKQSSIWIDADGRTEMKGKVFKIEPKDLEKLDIFIRKKLHYKASI